MRKADTDMRKNAFLLTLIISLLIVFAACGNPSEDGIVNDAAVIVTKQEAEITTSSPSLQTTEATTRSTTVTAAITDDDTEVPATLEPESSEEHVTMVWITSTGNGKRYHNNPDCSNMRDPLHVPIDEAIDQGLTPCKKCY